MKLLQDLSLKKRLVAAFAGVVILSALLSAVVFTLELVSTMRKSTRDKIDETSKVAMTHTDDAARGLGIYADLIASDMTFGQVLSFDSAFGIQQKVDEFAKLSGADLVAFIPRPEQFVQIKDQVFVNEGRQGVSESLKKAPTVAKTLETPTEVTLRGWMKLGDDLYLFATKSVLHFGSNMGAIFLARRVEDRFAKEVSTAAGADISIFDSHALFGTTLLQNTDRPTSLPDQAKLNEGKTKTLQENFRFGTVSYFSYFVPIFDDHEVRVATLALQVSNEAIQKARNQTILRVLAVAALATLLSALIGFFLARAISNPLQKITRGIYSIIEKGDLGIRIQGAFGAEIGILTNSFNRLLGQLQDAHEKLAASERRMKNELTMASTVQEMLFPEKVTRFRSMELASFIEASTETGGDWFGYDQDQSGDHVTVLIGDVTGHGMPAALITAIANGFFKGVQETQDALRASGLPHTLPTQKPLATSDMLKILNDLILQSTKGSLMMTFFASVLDAREATLRYANAGHNRPIFLRPGPEGEATVLASDPAPRLGEGPDVAFQENKISVRPGDVIVWYTDGIIECENSEGVSYGKRRFLMTLKKNVSLPPKEIQDLIIADAYRFYGDHPRKDDITLVIGKIL